jgi:hypothetical protein
MSLSGHNGHIHQADGNSKSVETFDFCADSRVPAIRYNTLNWHKLKVKVKVILRQSVPPDLVSGHPPSAARDQSELQLLTLASAVFLGSQFRGARAQMLLAQI